MTAPRLKIVGDDVPVAETPAQHVRNAIQMLLLAEDRLRVLTIPPDPLLSGLLRRAEARCFHALFAIGAEEAM